MEKHVNRITALLLIMICFSAAGQNVLPPLERTLTIELNGESTKQALHKMEEAGGFLFAYRTDLVDENNTLSRSYENKTSREILDDLFQGALVYKEKGNYIILKDAPKLKPDEALLEGYVYDGNTGDKIPYVSVYDSVSLASAVTDEYGYYRLSLSSEQEVYLTVSKYGYLDTGFVWNGTGKKVKNIAIYPVAISDSSELQDTSTFLRRLRNLKLFKPSEEFKANMINLKNEFQRTMQFSVVPGIGTNGRMSSNTTVDYSFNLLGGFNKGVRKLELGCIFNVDWDTVQYVQVAGMFNSVGGPQKGVQIGGITNYNGSSFEGAQIGGFSNHVLSGVEGVQIAGFVNTSFAETKGAQLAGFGNYTGDSSSVAQVGGFMNFARKGMQGTQVAGFMNYAGKDFVGTQVSGFINVGRNVTGTQVGFINVNDTINGATIGFFSFSRKGVHQLELSANEMMPLNVAFRTGSYRFYNTFLSGVRFNGSDTPYLGFGYGVGTSAGLGKKWRLFFDAQSMNLQRSNKIDLSLLNKLTISCQYQLAPKVAIAAGPSLNMFVVNNASTAYGQEMTGLSPYSIYDRTYSSDVALQTWVGGHIAIRFF